MRRNRRPNQINYRTTPPDRAAAILIRRQVRAGATTLGRYTRAYNDAWRRSDAAETLEARDFWMDVQRAISTRQMKTARAIVATMKLVLGG